MKLLISGIVILFIILPFLIFPQQKEPELVDYAKVTCGAQRTGEYMPLLESKNVAVVANQASLIGTTHLVDTLLSSGIRVVKIFSPEHGFRGNAEAGALIKDGKDSQTGLPVISLYGKHKNPTAEDMAGVDIVVFDLQDVGVRFYTYISTLAYVMESCAENNIPLVVLDRPNPNGFYVDGPVLEPEYSSFVGMHAVPVVYGMTIGEYAQMVNGKKWLTDSLHCDLTVISLKGYSHNMIVKLPVKPSPNLPAWESVYLYPSLAFFEGTVVSVGRGTDLPFQVYGHPDLKTGDFSFTPHRIPGVSEHPKFEGQTCYGQNLTGYARNYKTNPHRLNLSWLIETYRALSPDHPFFNDYFDKLAGTGRLRKQIEEGLSEKEIRASWQNGLEEFEKIRQKYLLYK
ncbi:MAG: DUF1343 domain-containing protein [Chlorobi bacterium]|nr:DUF1343 domain-containing protein [Chlorobiota bacterium]